MPRTHPPYPPEFRSEAVRLVREGGRKPEQLARDLGCSPQAIRTCDPHLRSALGSGKLTWLRGVATMA